MTASTSACPGPSGSRARNAQKFRHDVLCIIDECLKAWSVGADEKLLTLITDAFDVDKEGKLNTGHIISLRQLNIQDELWQQAMETLNKALVVSVISGYINFNEQDEKGKMANIPLDIAGV